ncbi:hypothetical protein QYF61_014520 [Mycteria americana]|uniref:Uncharacterized protein n=1 Tax=Mycteria americana TaxID=33587 RepID=A0AAN7NLM6_MYCAM|nr:hypothetical protein QYF61_014520 [Mycteria americana]
MATFLATWPPPEAWPEIHNGALVGRSGWLLVTGLRALGREVAALWRKMRELEKEVGTLQDAKVIAQEVIATQAEWCHGLQDTVERLIAHIAINR